MEIPANLKKSKHEKNDMEHICILSLSVIHKSNTYYLITKDRILKDHNGNTSQILLVIELKPLFSIN